MMVWWHIEPSVGLAAATAEFEHQPTVARRVRASFAESFAAADPEADAARRMALRRMKVVAVGFW